MSFAGAHPGATAFSVKVGVTSQVLLLVPADYGKPIDRIDIDVPATYHLVGAGTVTQGWQVTHTGTAVSIFGGTVAANDSAVFSITGEATAKGQLIFPVTTHSPDGTLMHYTGGPGTRDAGIVLYANTSSSRSWTRYLIVIGITVLAILTVGLLVIRRRARA